MKHLIRLLTFGLALACTLYLGYLSAQNYGLERDIDRLEAELGRMTIDDVDRVHLIEIESPEIPSEVAPHIDQVWQFRCYLPPNYDFIRFTGNGKIEDQGVYHSGGSSSSWSSPSSDATHKLLTISLQKGNEQWHVFNSFAESTSSWSFSSDNLASNYVVQKLVSTEQGSRSFNTETILPFIRIYDPSTATTSSVSGQSVTTYSGGFFALCPKSLEADFQRLTSGEGLGDASPEVAVGPIDE